MYFKWYYNDNLFRQISDPVKTMIENELRDGANVVNIRARVLNEHGVHLKPKTVHNLKQKVLGMYLRFNLYLSVCFEF